MKAIGGRYALEREIARGAFGAVWAAADRHLGRTVALKLLSTNAINSAAGYTSFEREAGAVAQLRSPHIVQVYDVGVEDGQPFIVMELLEGESLETRLERHPRLPLPVASGIIRDIAKGLATIHRAGIVHRDIKPANIFLAQDSGREVGKLLDFGIAARFPSQLFSEVNGGVPAGTPRFMSPERFQSAAADAHADLWALAVLAYQMLTGAEAFNGTTLAQLRACVCGGAFAPASTLCSELSDNVDAFFARAFAQNPQQRFPSAEEFSTEFLRLQQAEQRPILRLLFLDDEPDMQLLIRQRFRQLKWDTRYELHFATDAQRALEELRRRPDIDVVLTDLNMPGMDGLTFLSHVPLVNPFARVVVVSAYSDMANIRAAMNQGSFDFLGKPIDFDDLYRTIEKCGQHVQSLRKLLQSGEENDILRAIVGRGIADHIISSVRASDSVRHESFQAAVAFVDIHGFSKALANLRPDAVFEHLNEHFALFLPELLARGGTVNRFIGDAVMALFEGEDHLARAIDACLAIRERLLTLSGSNLGEDRRYGVTIGVDAGGVVAGGSGSLAMGRLEPAVVGGAISTAARLQALARNYEILISPAVHERIAAEYACEIDPERTVILPIGELPVVRVLTRPTSRAPLDGPRTATVELTPM